DKEITGKKIKSVQIEDLTPVRRHRTRKAFSGKLEGEKITGIERRGVYLLIHLGPEKILVAHMGETGLFQRATPKAAMLDHTSVIIAFTQGGQLRFRDPGEKSQLYVTSPEKLMEDIPELASLGMDPVATPIAWVQFGRAVVSQKVKLKALLTDESTVTGIGDLYADEIIFASGLRPDRMGNSLSTQEVRRLYRGLVQTLHEAVKARGTSLDEPLPFADIHNEPGSYGSQIMAYQRAGDVCKRCRNTISKIRVGGRATYLCESCQV
ncbi:MAG: Fpg/Nei family DNA glycosylase, partial [Acidimicrobiales bacterium]